MLARTNFLINLRRIQRSVYRNYSRALTTQRNAPLPEPEILLTEYGELVNVRPMKRNHTPNERKYREGENLI